MQILSVTLKNFKTHQDKHFTFAPGTNAICGENGAGKTSILEAIAWVLFNYVGHYAKDDLIRNGSSSAEVTVDFVSNLDGRTYAVQRHTNRGYTLFDPQLNERLPYNRIKDEVLPWLCDHFGIARGTDLGELFARTVGVPQGTFTADFLQSAENRKAVFDKVLKVEEYKTVYKDLNTLRRLAEDKVTAVDTEIATYEERLAIWEELQTRYRQISDDIAQNTVQLETLAEKLVTLEQTRRTLQSQAEQRQTLTSQRQQVQANIAGQQQTIALLSQNLAQAQTAAKICADNQTAYQAYQKVEAELQALGQQQSSRHVTQKKQQQLQKTLDNRAADMARLKVQLDNCIAAAAEIERLQPDVQQQVALETQLQALQQDQTALAQIRGELQASQQQITQSAQQIQQLTQDIEQLQALTPKVATIPQVEQQRDRLQQQLSRIEAARQFEAELRHLVQTGETVLEQHRAEASTSLTILGELRASLSGQPAAAIAQLGQTLEAGITINDTLLSKIQQILADLSSQTNADKLQSQLHQLQQSLRQLRQQQGQLAVLPERRQTLAHLQQQQTELTARTQTLQSQLTAGETVTTHLAEVRAELAALNDPKGRCTILARSQQQQPQLQQRYQDMQTAQTGIQTQIDELADQLAVLAELDTTIAQQQAIKQVHQAGYLQYLQHEQTAQACDRLSQELTTAQQALDELQQSEVQLQAQLDELQGTFDPQKAQEVEETYQTVRSDRDRLEGSLPAQRQVLQTLQQQIDELKGLAQKRDAAIAIRKHRERIKRFVNFARKAYKEAGPRITERYVQQISREGDRLFRELLNRHNVALTWTRDYEILVQEGPNTRRFINLSGGEQMCAALAVRLALLKVLADIDIAFFDEPTTNMDRLRRESLAEAIARIRSFSQLFVISHDDTFEKVTENVIVVERES
ncbi:MAG: AAA family ATPase [Leptolyngbyaceae cyanobacterium]